MAEEHHGRLCEVVDRLSKNNKRVKRKVAIELLKYKASKPPTASKMKMRLYYKSIEKLKNDLTVDLCVQLINIRMLQFVNFFKYIMGRMPKLSILCLKRLRRKYKKIGFGRCVYVYLDKESVEKERIRRKRQECDEKTRLTGIST